MKLTQLLELLLFFLTPFRLSLLFFLVCATIDMIVSCSVRLEDTGRFVSGQRLVILGYLVAVGCLREGLGLHPLRQLKITLPLSLRAIDHPVIHGILLREDLNMVRNRLLVLKLVTIVFLVLLLKVVMDLEREVFS